MEIAYRSAFIWLFAALEQKSGGGRKISVEGRRVSGVEGGEISFSVKRKANGEQGILFAVTARGVKIIENGQKSPEYSGLSISEGKWARGFPLRKRRIGYRGVSY